MVVAAGRRKGKGCDRPAWCVWGGEARVCHISRPVVCTERQNHRPTKKETCWHPSVNLHWNAPCTEQLPEDMTVTSHDQVKTLPYVGQSYILIRRRCAFHKNNDEVDAD